MADTSQQEFLAKTTKQLLSDIKSKKAASQARAHPTPQQLEEKEQERLKQA